MKALVTGASGFIGGYLVDALQREGHDVTALVRPSSDTSHLREVEARLAVGDVTDPDSLRKACEGQEWVVHTAAAVGNYGGWAHYRDVGVLGTKNVIDAAAAGGATRFVHLGSIAVYGLRPNGQPVSEGAPYDDRPERWNHYVREKVLSEKLLWKAHAEGRIQATSVRPSVVLGPRDRNAIPRIMSLLRSPLGALSGKGQNRVPCVVVDELAAATVKAASLDACIGKAYNLSGRETITQRQLLDAYAEAAGMKPLKRSLPEPLAMFSGMTLETLYRLARRTNEPFVTRLAIAIVGRDYDIDCSRAAAEFGWEGKADYFDAIRRSVDYFLEQARR